MSLTDEDKQWFAEMLGQKFAALDQKVVSLDQRFRELLDEKLALQARLFDEKLERVETNLLTEFHKWASPTEARNRSIATALRALDLEMEALSDRVKKIEGRQ